MRWPWVSRSFNDYVINCVNEGRRENLRLYGTINSLFEHIQALKIQGASVPEPAPTLQRPEFDPVQAAITAKAGPDKRLRAMMIREAMQSRAAGIPDIEIIQAIEQGVTVDEEGVA